jgi:hypothetical protein
VLRACRRLLHPGGRTGFLTIFVTPGLSKGEHRRAVRLGPRAVSADRTQTALLKAAGFIDVEETDVTHDFLQTVSRWLRFSRRLEAPLRVALGDQLFDEQQGDRTAMIAAVEEGLLSRSLFVATAPP